MFELSLNYRYYMNQGFYDNLNSFLIYNKKHRNFSEKLTFFTMPSFSEKLFFLVHAVKNPITK